MEAYAIRDGESGALVVSENHEVIIIFDSDRASKIASELSNQSGECYEAFPLDLPGVQSRNFIKLGDNLDIVPTRNNL